MKDAGRIVVTGSLAFDNIMNFPGYFKDHILPEKVHIINISFLVSELKKQRGGCAANIAYTLALLGERPRIVAAAGRDFQEYADYLQAQGVDVGGVRIFQDEVTASCFITTDQADNQITGFYPGAMGRAGEISLKQSAGPSPAVCIVAPDAPAAMVRHCREAREAGIPLIFDPSFQVTNMDGESLYGAARGARAIMLNDYEYAVFREKTGKSQEDLLDDVDFIVVTYGEQGSEVFRKGHPSVKIPAARCSNAVDPTGAGDAYRGGFVAGLTRGHDLDVCGRMGSVAAVYAVENYGTQNHRYTPEDFFRRYAENFGPVKSPVNT
ncbi:MAG: carbohydrate kinase family protein [Candidatus Eremiobacterota bacterium]